MTHKEYAESLRMIAAWFELHPEVKVPFDAKEFRYYDASSKTEMATLARALSPCEKCVNDDFFELHAQFGTITFRAVANRRDVCERVVTGTRQVEETVIPERIIPAHDEEIVEWRCPESLLEHAQ